MQKQAKSHQNEINLRSYTTNLRSYGVRLELGLEIRSDAPKPKWFKWLLDKPSYTQNQWRSHHGANAPNSKGHFPNRANTSVLKKRAVTLTRPQGQGLPHFKAKAKNVGLMDKAKTLHQWRTVRGKRAPKNYIRLNSSQKRYLKCTKTTFGPQYRGAHDAP